MTKKQFWHSAMNFGFLCGAALFVISILSWGLKLEVNGMNWVAELLRFALIFAVIIYTGRRNAALTGSEGYPYGRAVGFVFAMMLFAGIAAGVGQFLMANVIARDYYDAINAGAMETALRFYQGTPLEGQMLTMQDQLVRMLANPIVLIIQQVSGYIVKGGFLGLILGAFVKKEPDLFAGQGGGSNE